MGGARSEVSRDDPRADGGGDLERPEHPRAPRTKLGAAQRGVRRASRRACRPSRRWRPRRSPTRLMLELTRRDARRRARSTSAARPPPPRASIRLRDGARRAPCSARRPASSASAEILSALGFGVADARRRPRRHRPALAARRRHARGRPDRGGRAHRRRRASCPRRCPARRGAGGRLTPAQRAAPPRRGRARRPRPARDRRLELHRARRCSTGCASRRRPLRASWLENPMSEDAVDPAPDAARVAAGRRAPQRRARTPDIALFESGTRLPPRRAGAGERLAADEHHALGVLLAARSRRRRGAAPSRRPPTSSPPRRCSGRVLDTLRVRRGGAAPGAWPFLHPGRSAAVLASAARAGLARRAAPAGRRAWDLERRRGLRDRPRRVLAAAPAAPQYRDLTSFPAVRQDLAVVVPARRAGGATSCESCARRAASCCAGARSSTSTRRAGGRGRVSLALHLEFRAPRPDADRRGRRAACASDRRARCAASWGASCVAERRASLGRRRASPARSPRASCDRHPELRARRGHVALGRRARGWTTLYPRYRVALVLEQLDLDRHGDSTPRSSPTRTAPPRRSSPSCASAGCGWSTCQRRLPPARRRRPTSSGTASTARRELLDEAVYGLTELHRDAIAGARLVANPGCYPTASLLALAPLARAGLIADVVIDAKPGVCGAGRAPTTTTHLSRPTRTSALQGRRDTATRPRSSRSSPRSAPAARATFAPHLVPLDQGELVRCYVTPRAPSTTPTARAVRGGLRGRAVRRGRRPRRPACATCARRTSAALRQGDARTGKRDRLRGDRQPVEGHVLAGRAEPQPDVRAARDEGLAADRSS